MLIDYEYKNKNLICSYLNKKGDLAIRTIPWNEPYNWEECSPFDPDLDASYTTWDGMPVKKVRVTKPNKHSIAYYLYSQPKEIQEEIFRIQEPSKLFVDIETEVVSGFPDPKLAPTRILTIANVYQDKCLFLSLKELTDEEKIRIKKKANKYVEKFGIEYKFKFYHFSSEYSLVRYFFENVASSFPLITGWNFLDFDWMFLVKRAELLGYDVRNISLTGTFMPHDDEFVLPLHKNILDYQEIYVKFQQTVKVKESTALDFVANKLLGVKKIEYSGSLMEMYDTDFEKYALYNIIDTILVKAIDDKEKYLNIMASISNKSRTRFRDSLKTVGPTEGFIREDMLTMHNIVLVQNKQVNIQKVIGGWVKKRENIFLHWLTIFDFASLYPTTQRQNYIAPENYIGIVDETGEYAVYKYDMIGERRTKIDKNIHIITSIGTVFIKRNSATIKFLTDVYSDRKVNKKKATKAKKDAKLLAELNNILYGA